MRTPSLVALIAVPLVLGLATHAPGHSGEADPPAPPLPAGRPAPGPGGVATPGGGVGGPTTGGGGPGKGPVTGGPRGPQSLDPNRTSAPASATPASDHWSFWWFVNRRRYLVRAERRVAVTPGPGDAPTRSARKPTEALWRAEAQRALAGALGDDDEEIAASAAVALGKSGDASHAPLLLAVLTDSARRRTEREAAALGLGLLPCDEGAAGAAVRAALFGISADRKEATRLRAIATHALGLRGEQESVPFLLEAMFRREAAWDVIAAATVALGSVGDDIVRSDLERILAGGRGIDRVQRIYAAQGLARSGSPDALPALTKAAFDDDPHVRRAAYLAISAHVTGTDDKAVEVLVRAVHREKNGGARNAAAIALGATGHARADAALRHGYEKGDTQHRRFAALALGLLARERRDVQVVTQLEADLRTRANADLRGALAIALGLARRRAAGPLLREIATDRGDPKLRGYAALAIGLAGDDEGAIVLLDVLRKERDAGLRANAATALGLLGNRAAVPFLVTQIEGGDSVFVQGSATIALGRIGGADAAQTLSSVLGDHKRAEIVRSTAAIALGLLLDPNEGSRLAETGAYLDWTTLTTAVYELLQIQ